MIHILVLVFCLATVSNATLRFIPSNDNFMYSDDYYGVADLQGRKKFQEDRHAVLHNKTLQLSQGTLQQFPWDANEIEQWPFADIRLTSTLDNYPIQPFQGWTYFGVFDGHSGSKTSSLVSAYLLPTIQKYLGEHIDEASIHYSLQMAFSDVNAIASSRYLDGSTALVVFIHRKHNLVVVANAGDCRAIAMDYDHMVNKAPAFVLTVDHKPHHEKELAYITSLPNGFVSMPETSYEVSRVQGQLTTSRSIGDVHLQPYVRAVPEIFVHSLTNVGKWILMASDGFFNVFSSAEAGLLAQNLMVEKGLSLYETAEILVQMAYDRGSIDNITVMIIDLEI